LNDGRTVRREVDGLLDALLEEANPVPFANVVELLGGIVLLDSLLDALLDALLEVVKLAPFADVVELLGGIVLFPIGGPHDPVIIMLASVPPVVPSLVASISSQKSGSRI
jgi:hypothetical protein